VTQKVDLSIIDYVCTNCGGNSHIISHTAQRSSIPSSIYAPNIMYEAHAKCETCGYIQVVHYIEAPHEN